jgi:hypothetical protein
MKKRLCIECNEKLNRDEVALSQKMLGRDISEFYCINCLSEYLGCECDELIIKIEEFKEQGCALFL